ncbi:MAG: pentapeptide repeat-containing protein, partial [Ignavibacteria bacterium]|nr:pentapeptide repeat-containing protein [Ignavibacteria bacterium]
MESKIFIINKFIFSYEKNIKVISLILSLLLFSCNDSPVSPEMEESLSESKSNLFRNSDFILDENLILNENQIAEFKIDETIFQNSLNGNELFKLKYSPNTSGEFLLNFKGDILISEIRDSKNNLINNESHTGNKVFLNSDEVYSLSISKSKFSQTGESKLKPGDIIYLNTQRRDGSPIASIMVSQNSCDECRITNTTFSQNYNNMTFLFSEFINCKFENIQMDGNKFTGTFFQNCDFYYANITDNNFEKTNFIASNFSGDTEFKDCNFDNSNFSSNTFSSVGFFSSSFVRARMRLTSFDATLFQNCDMQYVTIYSPCLLYTS